MYPWIVLWGEQKIANALNSKAPEPKAWACQGNMGGGGFRVQEGWDSSEELLCRVVFGPWWVSQNDGFW